MPIDEEVQAAVTALQNKINDLEVKLQSTESATKGKSFVEVKALEDHAAALRGEIGVLRDEVKKAAKPAKVKGKEDDDNGDHGTGEGGSFAEGLGSLDALG